MHWLSHEQRLITSNMKVLTNKRSTGGVNVSQMSKKGLLAPRPSHKICRVSDIYSSWTLQCSKRGGEETPREQEWTDVSQSEDGWITGMSEIHFQPGNSSNANLQDKSQILNLLEQEKREESVHTFVQQLLRLVISGLQVSQLAKH